MPTNIILIGMILVLFLYVLISRILKYRAGKDIIAERKEIERRHNHLIHMLDLEQEEAARRIELRNEMFKLFDFVRNKYENDEKMHKEKD